MDIFKKIFQIFIGPVILGVLTILLHLNVEQTLFTWIILKIFVALSLVAHFFAFPALLYSLKEDLSVIESYKKAKSIVWSFLFVFILYLTFTLGGVLFLIIPGIIFTVLFSLCFFVLIFEEKKGTAALWRSRELVKGRGGHVFSFFLIIGIIIGILEVISNLAIASHQLNLSFVLSYLFYTGYYIALWVVLFNFYEKRKKENLSVPKPQGFEKALFVIPAIPGSLFVLVYFVLAFSVLFRDYDPPFDDSHMIIEEKEFLEEGNLYLFLQEEGYKELNIEDPRMDVGEQSYYDFILENPERAKEMIEANEEVYDYFEKMASYNQFMSPLDLHLEYIIPPGNLISISRAVSFKATYLFYEGREEEGMNLFLEIARVGNLFASDRHQILIGLLVGVGYQEMAYNNLNVVLKNNDSLEDLVYYSEKLEDYEIKERAIKRTFQREYMMVAGFLDGRVDLSEHLGDDIFDDSFLQSSFFFKPNKTKRDFAEAYYLKLDPGTERVKGVKTSIYDYVFLNPSHLEFYLYHGVKGNIVGEIIISATMLAINIEDQVEVIRKANFKNRATRINLLVNEYRNAKGKFPENLEEIVPEYLSELLDDPLYDDEKIRYSKEDRIIYSLQKEDAKEGKKETYIFDL